MRKKKKNSVNISNGIQRKNHIGNSDVKKMLFLFYFLKYYPLKHFLCYSLNLPLIQRERCRLDLGF